MRKFFLYAVLFIGYSAFGQQNIGIGTNSPGTKLDINGAIALREGQALTLANGGASGSTNDNIVLADIAGATGTKASFYRIVGPSAAFSIYGIAPVSGADGEILTLVNTTSNALTIKNNASSTAANSILTLTGADITSLAASSGLTMHYNKTAGKWYVTATQNFAVAAGSIATNSIVPGTGSSVTVTNGNNQVVGGGNVVLDVATNALNQKGVVSGPTGLNGYEAWVTDVNGNPTWAKVTNSMLNASTIGITAGTGISVAGSPASLGSSITVTNSAPDQTVVLNNGTGISVSGTYPNFTITNTAPSSGGTVTGSGTTNYVPKWTPSGSVLGNSLIFDNGTNVGVGTASPEVPLSVVGNFHTNFYNGNSEISVRRANGTAASPTAVASGNVIGEYVGWAYDGSAYQGVTDIRPLVTGTVSAGNVPASLTFFTSNTGTGGLAERMRIDNNGNLGIGSTSVNASNRLEVLGGGVLIGTADVHADASLFIYGSNGGFNRLTQILPTTASEPGLNLMASTNASNAAQWWVWGVNSNVWTIQPGTSFSGSAGLFVNASGQLGIGNAAPAYPVDVVGDINSSVGYTIGGAAGTGTYLRGNGTNYVSSAIQAADIPTGSGNYIQNQTGSAQSAGFNISGAGTIGGNLSLGGLTYQNTATSQGSGAHGISWYSPTFTSWYDYMAPPGTTNSPGGVAAASDAISGVTSWARRFNIENVSGYGWVFESQVNGASNAPTSMFSINSANGNFHSAGNAYVGGYVTAGASAVMGTGVSGGFYQDAVNGAYRSIVASGTSNGFYFSNNAGAATTMFVGLDGTYKGRVGIGTLTPSYALQVQKTAAAVPALMIGGGFAGGPRIQTYGLDADGNAWMGLGTDMSGGPYEHSIYFPYVSGGPYGKLTFGSYDGTTYSAKATLLYNGDFGIGNSTPTFLLEVGNGGATGKIVAFSQDNSYGQVQVANTATEASIGFVSAATTLGAAPTSTNGTSYVWDMGAGNYGIGGNNFSIGNQGYGGPVLTVSSLGNIGVGSLSTIGLLQPGASAANVIQLEATDYPQFISVANAGAANNKVWRTIARNSGVFQIQSLDDAGGTEVTGVQFTRSGNSITGVAFPNGTVSITGTANVGGVVTAGAYAQLGTNTTAGYYQDVTNGAYRSINASTVTNGYYFQTNGGASTTMYIGLGGTYNGNVGIGANFTTPTSPLAVGGNPPGSGEISAVAASGGISLALSDNVHNSLYIKHSAGPVVFGTDGGGAIAFATNGFTTAMTINASQNVSIVGTLCAASYSNCSDIRYKKDITPLTSALDNVKKLRGVNYYWRKDEFPDKRFSDKNQIGFIAQELEKIYPEFVITDEDGYKGVDYARLTPVLVEAIKEQEKKIESSQTKDEELEHEIASLKDENCNLQQKMTAFSSKTGEIELMKKQLDELKSLMEKNGIRSEK